MAGTVRRWVVPHTVWQAAERIALLIGAFAGLLVGVDGILATEQHQKGYLIAWALAIACLALLTGVVGIVGEQIHRHRSERIAASPTATIPVPPFVADLPAGHKYSASAWSPPGPGEPAVFQAEILRPVEEPKPIALAVVPESVFWKIRLAITNEGDRDEFSGEVRSISYDGYDGSQGALRPQFWPCRWLEDGETNEWIELAGGQTKHLMLADLNHADIIRFFTPPSEVFIGHHIAFKSPTMLPRLAFFGTVVWEEVLPWRYRVTIRLIRKSGGHRDVSVAIGLEGESPQLCNPVVEVAD